MRIILGAFGNLRNYTPEHRERLTVEVEDRLTVNGVLRRLGIPIEEVGLVAVNGSKVDDDRTLVDGDDLQLFAPIGGGTSGITLYPSHRR